MRVIIAGNRDFDDYDLFNDKLIKMLSGIPFRDMEIISGGCSGADSMAENFARTLNINLRVFPANWEEHGKAAGPIRNKRMAEYAAEKPDGMLIAFWDGKSRGTKNMIENALNNGLETHVIMWRKE